MLKGRQLVSIYNGSLALYPIKTAKSLIPITIRRYGRLDEKGQKAQDAGQKEKQDSHTKENEEHHHHHTAERAASTAEEFQHLAEEKARQDSSHQEVEKVDQEATLVDSTSG